MIRKLMLSLCAVASTIGLTAQAQTGRMCATDEFHKAQVALHPQILLDEARLKADIDRYISGRMAAAGNPNAKTAFDPSDATKPWPQDVADYHIPLVVHIIYDNSGTALTITDADIYAMVDRLNSYYNQTDPALSGIITPWKPYVANAHIRFHLANKDPQGNPTHGIVRQFSYASNGGDESAKINQWPPNQYLNLYLENFIGRAADKGIVLAYATFPTDYSSNPYSQGVISRADAAVSSSGGDRYTIAHEIGHFLYLYHPWNNNGRPVEDTLCGDDEVDDTPPTVGHFSCSSIKLYDTTCAKGYYKDYDSATFYQMTGSTGIIASNTSRDSSYLYNDSLGSVVGQSFTTGASAVPLMSISVIIDTGDNNGGTTSMSLYNGTTLVATSTNTPNVVAGALSTYVFPWTMLSANTTYKFVINNLGGHRSFPLVINNSNPYTGGTMYTGASANTPSTANDLYFVITQVRRIDYPDTTNTQNIMDYSSCQSEMFTKGQVARMRAALRSDVGYRSNLISPTNLYHRGIVDDTVTMHIVEPADIKPTALFTANRLFTCANGTGITFTNRSYNDTLSSVSWTFDKGATNATSNSMSSVLNSFSDTGWVTATLIVNGTNTGSDTFTTKNVYVADPTGITPYVEDFNPSAQLGRFPIFNYYNNANYKWEFTQGAGYYDNTSIKFNNYDPRNELSVITGQAVNTATQSPRGLYADFITPAYDLSGFGGNCFLDFYSAGAFRTIKPSGMNDTLLISYSTNCGATWNTLGRLTRADLANNGYRSEYFAPLYMGDWQEHSFPIATSIRTSSVFFRFRFMPGTDNAYLRYNGLDFGTGNNFYLDRLTVTQNPLSVKNGVIVKLGMSVQPNPTSGAATVRINGGDNSAADINVTDVTGKLVYHTSVVRKSATTEVEIPASVLSVKGMYLVQVVTNGATETQKLVAY